jgi:AcrR family transcriptional regulator
VLRIEFSIPKGFDISSMTMSRLKAPERRQQLLEVATLLFAERGFDATTTASIAAAAEVSEPILYRHFKSKQELFVQIIDDVTRVTKEHWNTTAAETPDPAATFREMATSWPKHIKNSAAHYQLLQNALVTSRDPIVREKVQCHYTVMHAFFVEVVRHGQKIGVFREDLEPVTTAWWILNGGIGFTLMHLCIGNQEGYDVFAGTELTLRALMKRP